jgi:hypothetical protein
MSRRMSGARRPAPARMELLHSWQLRIMAHLRFPVLLELATGGRVQGPVRRSLRQLSALVDQEFMTVSAAFRR